MDFKTKMNEQKKETMKKNYSVKNTYLIMSGKGGVGKTTVAVNEVFDYFISSTCTDDIVQVYHRGKLQG